MTMTQNVLLVEDNLGDARLLRRALAEVPQAPFALTHVERYDAGLQLLRQQSFVAALLDLSLPDTKGVNTVVRMQRDARELPIIVLTGLDDSEVALEAVRAGAQDYLVKGQIDGRLLVRSLNYAIERKRLQGETLRHLDRITALKNINTALTTTLNLPSVLKILLDKVAEQLPQVATTVRLLDKRRENLLPVACGNLDEQAWRDAVDRGCAPSAASQSKAFDNSPILIGGLQTATPEAIGEFCRIHGLTAYLGIPLSVTGNIFGILEFYAKGASTFSDQECEFFGALAGQAAAAIHNSQVYGEIEQMAADLKKANNIKDEFLGIISHELRTPLNIAINYAEMLRTGFFGELTIDQRPAIETIAKQQKLQLEMVNNILSTISLESSVAPIPYALVSLNDLFEEQQYTYGQLARENVKLEWRHSFDLPRVRTSQTKLLWILRNLIGNALKFTESGSITIGAQLIAPDENHDPGRTTRQLEISVADTGLGMDEKFLSVIFEKFSQVNSSTTRAHEGIGLGLYIVKRCTELLGGTVRVLSKPGEGSTFTVTIPCEPAPEPQTTVPRT